MTIDEGLYAKLAGDPVVRALVGDRLFPDVIPAAPEDESFPPAVAFGNSGETEEITQNGPCGLRMVTLQVACLAETPALAHELADLVRASLTDGAETWGDVRVWHAEVALGGRTVDDSTGTAVKAVVALNVTVAYRG